MGPILEPVNLQMNRSRFFKHLPTAALIILAAGCGLSAQSSDSPSKTTEKSGSESKDSGSTLHLIKTTVTDTQGTGKLALTYLVPEGWKCQDSIQWIREDWLTPAVESFRLVSPDGEIEIETNSGIGYNFGVQPMGRTGIWPPDKASSYFLREWKSEHGVSNVKVLNASDSAPTNPLAAGAQGAIPLGTRCSLQFEFQKSGKTLLCKMDGQADGFKSPPISTGMGSIVAGSWMTSGYHSVSAPQSRMPEAMKIFGVVMLSRKQDPHFFNAITQVRQLIYNDTQVAHQQAAEMSSYISRVNDQISDSIMSSYHSSQTVTDQSLENFDEYIRGVDRYNDSDSSVELPSGYNHAYTDGNGRYIVTDDHGYDPNENGPSGTWHEIDRSP